MAQICTPFAGSDELITIIPNTQLSGVRICNKSRMKYSGVQQKLQLSYGDIDKIPQLVVDIKEEIKQSCPKVVTDGSRHFREYRMFSCLFLRLMVVLMTMPPEDVSWTDYGSHHMTVAIDCRLAIPPSGNAYYDARQGVLEAIARAMKKNGVKCHTEQYIMREKKSK